MDEELVSTDFGRLLAFTDGVFAIAITLLVLSFDVPGGDHDVTRRVLDQWPNVFAYFLSFAVVGRFWLLHHRIFMALRRYDRGVMGINLAFLSFVCLIPFTSDLLGDHGRDTVAVVAYALVIAAAALLNWAQIRYTVARHHVRDEHRHVADRLGAREALLTPALFLASIPVAFVSPTAGELVWLGLIVTGRVGQRRGL